ncbi:MAG: glucose 1-dehydrogenase [Candidatus Dormibacteria bacterium]|jgi:glucose 1-dehydrogenase
MHMLLEGRRALVTGGSSGIGRATALRLGEEGARVAVNYRSERERPAAEAVAAAIDPSAARAFPVQADVGVEADVVRMVGECRERLGGLDLLVNNAGIESQAPTLEMSLEVWEQVLRTNLTGAFLCIREAGRLMAAERRGVIVNISSVHEFIPWPGYAHYCASKGGLKLLTETVALEWAPLGIRVLAIAPGAIATPINSTVLDDPAARRQVESEIPLGRFGRPEEIAAAVVWAASEEAAYLTGTTLVIDGGMSNYPRFR